MFNTTKGHPILAAPSIKSIYSTLLPAIMATMSPFWRPDARSARAVASLLRSRSRKVHLIFCHGTTSAAFPLKRWTCSLRIWPIVLCHSNKSAGPETIERSDAFDMMACANCRHVRAFTIHFHNLHLGWEWSIRAHIALSLGALGCAVQSRYSRGYIAV